MYTPPVCNEYIPFYYPETVEFVPDFEPTFEPFQWNPVPNILAPNMAKGEYNLALARDAFQFGIMPVEMNHD